MKTLLTIYTLLICFFSFSQTNISFSPASNGQTFSTCNGFIIDSGGQGGPGYSNNETSVITICTGTVGNSIAVTFNSFNLSLSDDDPSAVVNVDYMTIYDGATVAAPVVGVYTGTSLSGIVIQPTITNVSGCLTFKFTSNTVGTGSFTASVSCDIPCNDPTAAGIIVGGITSDSIRVCLNEPVVFENAGSFAETGFAISGYKWDFMDGTTALTEDATHSFTAPGLYRVQLFVTDNNPDNVCVNNNLIDLLVLVAPKPDFTGFPGDTTICIGESALFTAVPEDYEVSWTGFPHITYITDGCFSDNQLGVAQTIDLLQTDFIPGSTITSVNQILSICIEMEHTFIGDLDIKITCPNAQTLILHQQGGGGAYLGLPVQADGIDCSDLTTVGSPYTYCFTPTATQTWVDWTVSPGGATIPAGDYLPIDPFTNLIGCPTNGVWQLSVIDNWAADDGAIFSFGLNLDPMLYPVPVVINPQIGPLVDSSYWSASATYVSNLSVNGDVVTITPSIAGTYNYIYTVIDNYGCINDTSVNVIITPQPTAFAGNDTVLCDNSVLQLNGSITGGVVPTPSYVYSWSPSTSVSNAAILNPSLTATTEQTLLLSIAPVGHPLCIVTDNISISFFSPNVNLGEDKIICSNSNVTLTDLIDNPTASYLWSTGETTESITVNTSGNISIISSNGSCFANDTINVSFIPAASLGVIPNVISSDGDGKNDSFHFPIVNIDNFSIIIVNRWGEKIFETTDTTLFWDGTYNGKKVSDGVYFYIIKYSDPCIGPDEITLDGNVTVFGH